MSNMTEKEKDTIVRKNKTPPESDQLLELVTTSLDDDKANDVTVINLAGKTSFADHMVIATGTSQRHVATMAEHLRASMKSEGVKRVALEGMTQCDWVLLDGGDVIVHLFRPEVREFYDLEKIWIDPVPQPSESEQASLS
jgi:ribosome-associated protein